MKKPITILATVLIMLSSVAVSISADFAPFEVEGVLTEFSGVDDMLEYRAGKQWVHEPWYSDDYFDQKINYIGFMESFLYIPNDYRKSDIEKIWLDDVKVVIFLKGGSRLSYEFRDAVGADIHLPFVFYYCKGGNNNYAKLGVDDVQNVMYDENKEIDYSKVLLKFSGIKEMLNYIESKKWTDELWYHPALEIEMVNCMQNHLNDHLFIPVEYTKDDILAISLADKTISVAFKDGYSFSYSYSVFDKAESASTSAFQLSGRKVHNIMPSDSSINVIEPIECCDIPCE